MRSAALRPHRILQRIHRRNTCRPITTMSMHNNFSDASNESQQMQLLEGHFQDDVMAGLPSGRGDDQSMIEFQPDFSVMSGASSNHQIPPFQRPTI
eukprot:scaffold5688_cov104-Cylindrotheca_fusiformis.AAC.16